MSYATAADLNGLIPEEWVVAASSDASASDAIAAVLLAAEDEVNNWISRKYPLPLDLSVALANAVPTLRHVTRYIAAYLLYGRRGMQKEFPFIEELKMVREDLKAIARGEVALFPTAQTLNYETVAITTPNRVDGARISV